MWYDMDNRSVLTTIRGYPSEVIGRVDIVKEPSGNEVLGLTYDFTGGTGTKAVYAVFNQGAGSQIGGFLSNYSGVGILSL
ncbi:hypothetical protein ERICI_00093 [Paenibacillus larvae subsp. larvae]|uniref:Uncharacterized protein n=3 Tax=Paenibacillus larvae TaxID=1464 RepID=V9W2V5_9BACL|nr:hypothetical protein [Paenibacillus larvae]AHD03970.1 hypothetical protein ERIC2_c00890 [Paenibacillus larvae subsp. larvae DSM 25430]AVF20108.1 hypothetical protein ERICI_00093 [Paenibacillus larvae subsp. larvae]ETK29197.1 hypothetical protein ERIC1_1c27030 [Paenibacillus larvae subsp. larvae DSM 25719]AVG10575.1 hypothetical protein ERICII_00095 [Paenibacillus larvae subsp. larvae DSM 25430]MDT2239844.1 hypothetical protein [Paenibacillus larvae]